MKKMKISTRILLGFLIAIALTVVLGIMAIYGLHSVNQLMDRLYTEPYQAAVQVGVMKTNIEKISRNMYQMSMTRSQSTIDELKQRTQARYSELLEASADLATLYPNMSSQLNEFNNLITTQAQPISDRVMATVSADVDNTAEIGTLLDDEYTPILTAATDQVTLIEEAASADAAEFIADADSDAQMYLTLIFALLIIEAAVALFLAVYITKTIRDPIHECVEAMALMSQGLLATNVTYHGIDETGKLADAIRKVSAGLQRYIATITRVLGDIAEGNLDTSVNETFIGDFEQIGSSLDKILSSLNNVFMNMDQAAGQVAVGANEVSRGAQALAEGSTKQSSSVEELSVAVSNVNTQIQQTTSNINDTQELVGTTTKLVDTCNAQMSAMLNSMNDINTSSQEISKIIKTIDDISFQTNILALNAAVEAARAGTAGQGFAVVADEVRNLATKSADAAKETSALIEGSLQKVEVGNRNAMETAELLKSIVENTMKINTNVNDIEHASQEQAHSVAEINTNVEQISTVVQTNSATAQESAAASEELSGQADMMKQMVGRFKLKDSGMNDINMDFVPSSSGGHHSWDDDSVSSDKY